MNLTEFFIRNIMHTAILITFIIYFITVLIFGIIAYRQTHNLSDYVLGGRKLGVLVAGLSTGASGMSAWLLLGLPGDFYTHGLNRIWLVVCLLIGTYLNWFLIAKRLRVYTEKLNNSLTVSEFLHNRFQDDSHLLRVISSLTIILFFTFYVSMGLVSGAMLFESSFGLNYTLALWISAFIIITYTVLGGFLAVSWTDVLQGFLMLLAMIIVPIGIINELGSWEVIATGISQVEPARLELFGSLSVLGFLSFIGWGLGYFGQPHLLVRFMAIKEVQSLPKARWIDLSWKTVSMLGAGTIGIVGIAYFANNPLANPEKLFIEVTQILFNPWVAGGLLVALLSAIMSTMDSQLLVCSSAITEDFYRTFWRRNASQVELVWVGRISLLAIAFIALALAHNPQNSILELVGYAWAGLGSSLGPVVIFSLYWRRMTRNGALAGMIVGAVTVIVWERLTTFGVIPFSLYEMVPAFTLSCFSIVGVSLLGKAPKYPTIET
jgi:sodium/proline symporter